MSDDTKLKPVSIQRNPLDVATDLTLMYYSSHSIESKEDVQDTFLRFYAVSEAARLSNYRELYKYLPESLKEIIKKQFKIFFNGHERG